MFATTQKSVSMILGAALVAFAAFQTPAFAGEASLSQNERAAQSAIVGTLENLPASVDASSATLARNEDLAQRLIVDTSVADAHRVGATDDVTLTQNEVAAQRAIADATASAAVNSAGAATTTVVSTRSPAQH